MRQQLQRLVLATLVGLSALTRVPPARAFTTPQFPNCPNPGGTVRASYTDGIHGIPGRTETYRGSDVVYDISPTLTVQCYCAPDSSGIQTNWWKVSSLSSDETQALLKEGWIYIPDGAAWGLTPGEWLAQNISYHCGEKGGGTTSTTGTVLSAVSAIIPAVLGFADTGRTRNIWRAMTFSVGVVSTFLGIALFVSTRQLEPPKKSRKTRAR